MTYAKPALRMLGHVRHVVQAPLFGKHWPLLDSPSLKSTPAYDLDE
jgi:hypothetical protein